MIGLSNRRGAIGVVTSGALVIGLAFSAGAGAATYRACVNKRGVLRIVANGAKCKKHERGISFNSEGIPGRNGTNGNNGLNGLNGVNGATGFTSTLPTGKTEEGTWAVAAPKEQLAYTSISFVIPLAAAATANVILAGGSPTPACPGSPTNPQAASGNLCVYTAKEVGLESRGTFNPDVNGGAPGAGPFGIALFIRAVAGESAAAYGTWAVTG